VNVYLALAKPDRLVVLKNFFICNLCDLIKLFWRLIKVPQKSLMPKVDGCVKNNDCPAFSKCQRGICICFTSYEVISGLCSKFLF
jgi:hypothetical protein